MASKLSMMFFYALVLASLAVCGIATSASASEYSNDTLIVKDGLLLKGDGFIHFADDGIKRSYAANGTVIDYQRLSNTEIHNMIARLPASMKIYADELSVKLKNVDGNDVTDQDQILNPPAHLKPIPDHATSNQQTRNDATKNKKALEERAPVHCEWLGCTSNFYCWWEGCAQCARFSNPNYQLCFE